MKTAELIGSALDWAVAKCEELPSRSTRGVTVNREIFFLIWDSEGLHNAAKSAFNAGVCLAQTQLWTNQRNGRKKAPYFSKMLRQKRQIAFSRV